MEIIEKRLEELLASVKKHAEESRKIPNSLKYAIKSNHDLLAKISPESFYLKVTREIIDDLKLFGRD